MRGAKRPAAPRQKEAQVQTIIVGAGTVGFDLARQLLKAKHDIAVIERDSQRCAQIGEKLDVLAIPGMGTSPPSLESAGIGDAELCIAVTSVDEVNILVCSMAEQYGVPTRIARVRNRELTAPDSPIDLASLGVTRVINPERLVVRIIDHIARIPDAVEVFGYHDGEVLIARHIMTDQMPVIGRSLLEIPNILAADHYFLAVAIKRGGRTWIPAGDDRLQPGDDVTTVFPFTSLPEYLRALGLSRRRVRRAVVAGQGLTVQLLCETLRAWIEDVTLIDPDPADGQSAAESLQGLDVIEGDPTDRTVLQEVNVSKTDLFVGAGRSTTQNVMGALLARSEGAPKVLAVSYEPQNNRLFRQIGVSHVVSPRRAMTQEIMDVIHRGRGAMELQLRDMPLESFELRAEIDSPITAGPLSDVWAPWRRKAIIGAVIRDGRPLLPRGETRIQPEDDVIVITEPKHVDRISKLFRRR
ncbi:MAG: Trk system potassium transporter TrkA [Candidatus Eisenbacteria bacterium]|nr:Trk system potassium transporter TrkA [Candidatus Eisenbacteria bacterium]